ncbi:hypothetical protein N7G274_002952 [Stereocaulon virgatum]|uniref:Uncharacterized protein n=1 Tax=Stereocaulon virgatum TaxID=373712 RepID=A0ABR4AEJ0_9LECA
MWQTAEVKVITVTQDVFAGSNFDIACRKFIPAEGDSLERIWKRNGVTQYYPRALYAIANMRETSDAIARFVATRTGPSVQHYINVRHEKLLQSIYAMAYAMVFRPIRFTQNEDLQRLLQEIFQM